MKQKTTHEKKLLVVGFPFSFANAVIEELGRRQGSALCVLCCENHLPSLKLWSTARRRKKIEIILGSSKKIDMGMNGAQWLKTSSEVQYILHFLPHTCSIEEAKKSLNETIELAKHSPTFKRLIFLNYHYGKKLEKLNIKKVKNLPTYPWLFNSLISEKILELHRRQINYSLIRCGIPIWKTINFCSFSKGSIIDHILQIMIILVCDRDIKNLKKLSERRLILSPVEKIPEIVVNIIEGSNEPSPINFFYNTTISVDKILSLIADRLSLIREDEKDFEIKLRKSGSKLLRAWLGRYNPFETIWNLSFQKDEIAEDASSINTNGNEMVEELKKSIEVHAEFLSTTLSAMEEGKEVVDELD